jgi:syntaxin-binding protein 5
VTPSDMDILSKPLPSCSFLSFPSVPLTTLTVGGPDRPPSKRMLAQSRADEASRLAASRTPASASTSTAQGSNEGWGAYMQRQLQERTEKLNIMGDSMENLENNSQGWADDVSKFVSKQKRGAVTGLIKHKFGF